MIPDANNPRAQHDSAIETLVEVEPTDVAIHYSFLADIYKQTKDLPDGTPIKAVVVEGG